MIVVLAAVMLLPNLCGSAEYTRNVSAENVIENRAGQVLLTPRSGLSKRIENFIRKYRKNDAAVWAEVIAACEHPRVLAAIAARESQFDERAIGRLGEIGAYQQRPEIHGHPGVSILEQTQSAEKLLSELVAESHGKLYQAVRAYNGAGPRAEQYAASVLAVARSI